MNIEEYKNTHSDNDSSPGWDAIDSELLKLYPNQEPKHFAAVPHYAVGGNDPLDGISLYRANDDYGEYFHIVTYGFSQLYYDEESFGQDYSKFGFELTFRVRPFAEDKVYPYWAINLLQNLARYVFNTGNWFDQYHYFPANGPLRLDCETDLVALFFIEDSELKTINTVHGEVKFLQVVGITEKEFQSIKSEEMKVNDLAKALQKETSLLVTDLCRKDS